MEAKKAHSSKHVRSRESSPTTGVVRNSEGAPQERGACAFRHPASLQQANAAVSEKTTGDSPPSWPQGEGPHPYHPYAYPPYHSTWSYPYDFGPSEFGPQAPVPNQASSFDISPIRRTAGDDYPSQELSRAAISSPEDMDATTPPMPPLPVPSGSAVDAQPRYPQAPSRGKTMNHLNSFQLRYMERQRIDAGEATSSSQQQPNIKSEDMSDEDGDEDYVPSSGCANKPKRSNKKKIANSEGKSGLIEPKFKKSHSTKGKKANRPAILHPTSKDILRGRGGATNRHPGNHIFRDEARKLRAEYRDSGVSSVCRTFLAINQPLLTSLIRSLQDTTRHEKYLLSIELVKRVKAYGGRFLERYNCSTNLRQGVASN